MRSLFALKRGRGVAAAIAIAFAGLLPSAAKALPFQYAPGEIIGVINKGGTDLIMNFGALPASGTTTKSFALPSQFSGSLAGASFNGAFRVADASAFPEVIQFTTNSPLNFPDPNGDFAAGISAASSSLGAIGTGWFAVVATAPAPPANGNVFARDTNVLALNAAYSLSYTSVIGLGTDTINSSLTNGVNTRTTFGALTSASLPFYTLTFDFNNNGDSVYQKTLLGAFTAAQSGSNLDLTFSAIPEPGPLLLVMSGLTGLGVFGRRKSA